MNSREKILAIGVGIIVSLFVGNYFYKSIQKGFSDKKQKIEDLNKRKQEQELEQMAGVVAAQKLNAVVPRSLPSLQEAARADYREWLIQIADSVYLQDPTPKWISESKDSVKGETYRLHKFMLTGTGTIETATELLYAFYSKDYLHRINDLELSPITSGKDPNLMSITLKCEVLSLNMASEKQKPPTEHSRRLTKSLDDYYATIVDRNIFAPLNNPPKLAAKKSLDAIVGMRLEHAIEAKDPDPNQYVSHRLLGEPQRGMTIDKETGKLTWTPREAGEVEFEVEVWDSGIPAKASVQLVSIKVKEPPKPAPTPKNFDVASQAAVTAFIVGRKGPEAWVYSKTDDKKYYLHKGDPLKLGSVEGKVIEIGANYMELETEGKRWTVGLDESLADAYSRGISD
ncbi:MAG: hypothetical protein ABL921_10320 [Pirellula sp.]